MQQRFASPPPKQLQRSPYIIPVSASSSSCLLDCCRALRAARAWQVDAALAAALEEAAALRGQLLCEEKGQPPQQQHQQQQHTHMQQRPVAHSCAVLARQPVKSVMAT